MDWRTLVNDLRGKGLTLAEIGAAIGMTTGGVGDISSGRTKSPRGEVALKLHALWLERCGKKSRKAA